MMSGEPQTTSNLIMKIKNDIKSVQDKLRIITLYYNGKEDDPFLEILILSAKSKLIMIPSEITEIICFNWSIVPNETVSELNKYLKELQFSEVPFVITKDIISTNDSLLLNTGNIEIHFGNTFKGEDKSSPHKFPKEIVNILNESYKISPYPNKDEKARLLFSTNLTDKQLNHWFANARVKERKYRGIKN
jgi:hypothetical protein